MPGFNFKHMRYLFFLLLFPFVAPCQTVHIHKEKIVYNGPEKTNGLADTVLFGRAKLAVAAYVKNNDMQAVGDSSITTEGIIVLSSPYSIIKKLHYKLILVTGNNSYHYHIDSVYLSQKERGEKAKKITSKELFKNMEVSGPVAMNTEILLNEIDMRIQQLLDMIKNEITKPAGLASALQQ